MEQALDIQELAIVIAANSFNPTIVNPDFLKFSDIVPSDWELARPPALTNQLTQIVYQNGVSVVAQPGALTVSESLSTKTLADIEIAKLAHKAIDTLPSANYQAVGINPRRLVTFPNQPDGGRRYVVETLLASGPWKHLGTTPVKASINLAYTLEHCQLRLSIGETRLQLPDEEFLPAVLFTGNFQYEVVGNQREERLQSLHRAIDNWQSDLATYQELINTKFLNQAEPKTVFRIKDTVK